MRDGRARPAQGRRLRLVSGAVALATTAALAPAAAGDPIGVRVSAEVGQHRADARVGTGAEVPPAYVGAPAVAKPVKGGWLPDVPGMSTVGAATMHGDGYSSDTHPFSGALGRDPQVRYSPKGPCAGLAVTSQGPLVLQCGGVLGFTMRLVDPVTLEDLATYNLPPRPSTIRAVKNADIDKIYSDSSGAYFYLEPDDTAVVADAAQDIQKVAPVQRADGTWAWEQRGHWDLTPYLPAECETFTDPTPTGENCDPVTAVQPDGSGLIWWASRFGRVGTLDPETGTVRLVHLEGEQVQNSFSVDETGAVSIVSDFALYSFRAAEDGTPRVVWREEYDRGSARKTGQINQGSGTTPTLLGKDWVAITDNADGRMNVVVYRRADVVDGPREVCRVPVFGDGQSATENSLVGYGNAVVVENNYGYLTPATLAGGKTVVGGLTRVDVTEGGCRVAWTSEERSPSVVPKLSRGNGLLYVYTKEANDLGLDAWYLTAVDWRTGKTAYKVRTGFGVPFDNAWAPITVGPDVTYVSSFGGLISVRDGG